MSDTMQLCCRVCLELEGEQVCALGSESLRQQLEACLAISVSEADELPTVVCGACVARLEEFHAFREAARSAQDWLESTLRTGRRRNLVQPLADSDYNSDSLLDFLNNTDNIEEYLDGLGDPDAALPSLVGLLDRQADGELGRLVGGGVKVTKITSSKAEEARRGDDTYEIHMEIDVLDSDADERPASAAHREAYSCLACKAAFERLGELGAHMSVCESATRTCFRCGLLFDSKQKMLRHRASHGDPGAEHACDTCAKKFATRARLVQHYEKFHSDFVASMGCVYRCKECGELFRDRLQLYRHAAEHVGRGVRSERLSGEAEPGAPAALYRCKVCRVVCADRRQLYTHVKRHAAAVQPRRHLCHACGRSYTSLAALERHVATHAGGEAPQTHAGAREREAAVCEFCGVTFLKHDFLRKHLKELHS